jgi:hypothetical protein
VCCSTRRAASAAGEGSVKGILNAKTQSKSIITEKDNTRDVADVAVAGCYVFNLLFPLRLCVFALNPFLRLYGAQLHRPGASRKIRRLVTN